MMKMEEKLQHAILATLQLKGLTVHMPKPTNFVDLYRDKVEIGVNPEGMNSDMFMYTFYEMLRKGEVELNFRFDKMEKRNVKKHGKEIELYKHFDLLMRLDIEPEEFKNGI